MHACTPPSPLTALSDDLHCQVLSREVKPGLVYEVYAGAFDRLPDFDAVNPTAAGVTPKVGLHVLPRVEGIPQGVVQSGGHAVRFQGILRVPIAGEYAFSVGSNDGSRLWVDNVVMVDNDGTHYYTEASGSVLLR